MHVDRCADAGPVSGWLRATPAPDVESVWFEPPESPPTTLLIASAPPPMLVQRVPPRPFPHAVWVGGYWVWHRRWVWAHGMWAAAPRAGLRWVHPRYEHRSGLVLFVAGHWAEPGDAAEPPLRRPMPVVAAASAAADPTPLGPEGPFVPAPPGSLPGLIVPAPAGVPPAVMTAPPPAVAEGMAVSADPGGSAAHVSVTAPAGTTVGGSPLRLRVPVAADLAAALEPVVHAWAPKPRSELAVRLGPGPAPSASAALGGAMIVGLGAALRGVRPH